MPFEAGKGWGRDRPPQGVRVGGRVLRDMCTAARYEPYRRIYDYQRDWDKVHRAFTVLQMPSRGKS